MLSRRKTALIALIGFHFLFCGFIYFWMIQPDSAAIRKQTSEMLKLNASQFLSAAEDLDEEGMGFELTGLEIIGAPAARKITARRFTDFVMVGAELVGDTRATGKTRAKCLIAGSRQKIDTTLAEKIEAGKLSGIIQRDPFEELDEDAKAYLRTTFPEVDFEKTALLWHRDFREEWLQWIGWLVLAVQIPNIAYFAYQLLKKEKRQPWQDAIEQDRTEVYRRHQKAMRLIGNESFATGSLRHRTVDSEFDVAAVKTKKYAKPKRAIYYILGLGVYFALTVWCKSFIRDSEWLANIDSVWLEIATILPLAIGYAAVSAAAKGSAIGLGEEEITRDKARYRDSEFHQYHSKVLNELGFIEIGDYKQIGSPAILTRTIYLSPIGNLLVEIGTQDGHHYFTLESLTNGGKFLETHSMISPKLEVRNESAIHQRWAADHQDIIKALEMHDELVSEFTFTGSAYEAKFTPENFARFLAYPSAKKLA